MSSEILSALLSIQAYCGILLVTKLFAGPSYMHYICLNINTHYFIYQVNKHNQCADRAILITDKGIYKLDPKKKYKPLRSIIPFQQVCILTAVLLYTCSYK